jgi:hypothetical protein
VPEDGRGLDLHLDALNALLAAGESAARVQACATAVIAAMVDRQLLRWSSVGQVFAFLAQLKAIDSTVAVSTRDPTLVAIRAALAMVSCRQGWTDPFKLCMWATLPMVAGSRLSVYPFRFAQMIRRELRDGRIEHRSFVRTVVEAARVVEKRGAIVGMFRADTVSMPGPFTLQVVAACSGVVCEVLEEEEVRGMQVGASLFALANLDAAFGTPAENMLARYLLCPLLDLVARRLENLVEVRLCPGIESVRPQSALLTRASYAYLFTGPSTRRRQAMAGLRGIGWLRPSADRPFDGPLGRGPRGYDHPKAVTTGRSTGCLRQAACHTTQPPDGGPGRVALPPRRQGLH